MSDSHDAVNGTKNTSNWLNVINSSEHNNKCSPENPNEILSTNSRIICNCGQKSLHQTDI
jgi:hypothetical protein